MLVHQLCMADSHWLCMSELGRAWLGQDGIDYAWPSWDEVGCTLPRQDDANGLNGMRAWPSRDGVIELGCIWP